MMLVSCESDDDDDDGDTGLLEPPSDGWTYTFTVGSSGSGGYYSIYALDYTVIIGTCALLIDGEEQDVSYDESYNEWSGTYPFQQGESYNIDLTINNTHHQSIFLPMPFVPDFDSPETWDGQTEYELTWGLTKNACSQSLFIHGPDEGNHPRDSQYILASLRSYMLPPDFHGYSGETDDRLTITLYEKNWVNAGGLLFVSFANDVVNFGYDRMQTPHEHTRRIVNDVIREIHDPQYQQCREHYIPEDTKR